MTRTPYKSWLVVGAMSVLLHASLLLTELPVLGLVPSEHRLPPDVTVRLRPRPRRPAPTPPAPVVPTPPPVTQEAPPKPPEPVVTASSATIVPPKPKRHVRRHARKVESPPAPTLPPEIAPPTAPAESQMSDAERSSNDPPVVAAPSIPKAPSPEEGPSAVDLGPILSRYGSSLMNAVRKQRNYPGAASGHRSVGTAVLKVRVARNGDLDGVPVVTRSSSSPMLDQEAIRMVEAAAPFPPLPEVIAQRTVEFSLPVEFRLSN